MKNESLHKARKIKNDEFYTYYEDIAKELPKYKKHFKNKIVYMPCDDPAWSNFWRFFLDVFDDWQLKCIKASFLDGFLYEFDGKHFRFEPNYGDFRQNTHIKCDIVCTNPPFSLFRDFLQCFGKKKLVFIGPITQCTTQTAIALFFYHKLFLGGVCKKFFSKQKEKKQDFGNCVWWASWPSPARLELTTRFADKNDWQYSDDGVLCLKYVKDTPVDYKKPMLVPLSFLSCVGNYKNWMILGTKVPIINNKCVFRRFIIQNKKYYKEGEIYGTDKQLATVQLAGSQRVHQASQQQSGECVPSLDSGPIQPSLF